MRLVRPSTSELRVTIGRYENGRPRSLTRTVRARSKASAAGLLAAFVNEMTASPLPGSQDIRDTTVDEGIDRFLEEYLANEKGRAERPSTTTAISINGGSRPPSAPNRSNESMPRPWTGCSVPCGKPDSAPPGSIRPRASTSRSFGGPNDEA